MYVFVFVVQANGLFKYIQRNFMFSNSILFSQCVCHPLTCFCFSLSNMFSRVLTGQQTPIHRQLTMGELFSSTCSSVLIHKMEKKITEGVGCNDKINSCVCVYAKKFLELRKNSINVNIPEKERRMDELHSWVSEYEQLQPHLQ